MERCTQGSWLELGIIILDKPMAGSIPTAVIEKRWITSSQRALWMPVIAQNADEWTTLPIPLRTL